MSRPTLSKPCARAAVRSTNVSAIANVTRTERIASSRRHLGGQRARLGIDLGRRDLVAARLAVLARSLVEETLQLGRRLRGVLDHREVPAARVHHEARAWQIAREALPHRERRD